MAGSKSGEQPGKINSRLENLRNLAPAERLDRVIDATSLGDTERAAFGPGALPLELANGMIENVIGTFELPVGIATNFTVNGRDYLIPMAVEEPSVVAAASYMARIVRKCGGFQTSSSAPIMRAQVQVLGVTDVHGARARVLRERDAIIEAANAKDKVLISLGGGCRDVEVHVFENTSVGPMMAVHLIVDVRDAMGANTVNTMAETVAPLIEKITGGEVRLRILSNYADLRIARAMVRVTPEALKTD
jgi:hydroxymethylglutaryl-CoA reductase